MAASRTRRPLWCARAMAAVAVALALVLIAGATAPAPGAAYDVSVDPSAIPRIPCGTPEGELIDFWCGDWATDPPALSAQPQKAFPPFGTLRLERIAKAQSDLLRGRPFGDVKIDSTCGGPALYYAGTYEGGQVVACTADDDEALVGVYREEAPGDLRSGSFEIAIPRTARTFVGGLHQTLSGTPDNDWSGRCTGGWCATVVRPQSHTRCSGRRATIVGEVNPLGTNLVFGTPKDDVIVGTDEPDVIAGGAGNDLICGGDGRDVIIGNSGKDRLFGEGGDDVLRSSSAKRQIEVLDGGEGDDSMRGGFGIDVIHPGPGTDVVEGGGGRDAVEYSEVSAAVLVSLARGVATGRTIGRDRLIGIEGVVGSRFGDVLVGASGNDVLIGGPGDDSIRGMGGPDRLLGDLGDDLLDGGEGHDEAFGGHGVNRCRSVENRHDCERVLP
jgi:hypothetical protein